jgi:hypothetical protein
MLQVRGGDVGWILVEIRVPDMTGVAKPLIAAHFWTIVVQTLDKYGPT